MVFQLLILWLFVQFKKSSKWCHENFLNYKGLFMRWVSNEIKWVLEQGWIQPDQGGGGDAHRPMVIWSYAEQCFCRLGETLPLEGFRYGGNCDRILPFQIEKDGFDNENDTHTHLVHTPPPPVNPSLIYTLTDTRKSYSGLSHAVKIREQLKNLVKSFGVAIESADGKRETYFNFHPLVTHRRYSRHNLQYFARSL